MRNLLDCTSKEGAMTTRFLLPIALTLFCTLPACIGLRLAPYPDLGDRTAEMDERRALAGQGTAADKFALGARYEHGRVASQDYQEAVYWYRQAATQGDADAQYKLCVLSDRGLGMLQDYREAMHWCGLAADQGHGRAMFNLGIHFQDARGVPPDWVQAHRWYNLAAANGYQAGAKWRDRLAQHLTAAQIAAAQRLAWEWTLQSHSVSERP
jgi:uncharacterized protein